MKNKKRSVGLKVTGAVIIAAVVVGSILWFTKGKEADIQPEQTETASMQESTVPEKAEKQETEDVMMTASDVVQDDDGTIYYWEYHDGSIDAEAAGGNYQFIPGTVNRLMERKPSGESSVVVETEGSGDLALADNMILFENPIDTMNHTEIFQLNLSDKSIKSLGEGKLKAVSDQQAICSDNEEKQLDVISLKDGTRDKIADGTFLTVEDNKVYYQPKEEDETAAAQGQVSLAMMDPDGSHSQVLCTTAPDLSDGSWTSEAKIVHMVFQDDKIYFSYGSYGGSMGDYQGGKIMCVNKDGSEANIVAGNEELQKAVFSVDESGTVKSTSVNEASITISPMERYYVSDGEIYFFKENGEGEAFVTQADYASISDAMCGSIPLEGEALTVSFAQKTGDYVYMQLDKGEATQMGSAGWRTNIQRTNSALLCKNLKTGKTETIYTF